MECLKALNTKLQHLFPFSLENFMQWPNANFYLRWITFVKRKNLKCVCIRRLAQLAELPRSKFDPEIFPHSAYVKIFATKVPYLTFCIKICHILSQNVKYGTFVANVTKKSTYTIWGNNSGSNLLRGSSASCAGLAQRISDGIIGSRLIVACLKFGSCRPFYNKTMQAIKLSLSMVNMQQVCSKYWI